MEKTEVLRKVMRNRQRELEIVKKLEIDSSGFVIYPGTKGSVAERTGSPAISLINWYLYKTGTEKPLDYALFDDLMSKIDH
jgi:hypothetical protein